MISVRVSEAQAEWIEAEGARSGSGAGVVVRTAIDRMRSEIEAGGEAAAEG